MYSLALSQPIEFRSIELFKILTYILAEATRSRARASYEYHMLYNFAFVFKITSGSRSCNIVLSTAQFIELRIVFNSKPLIKAP